jgi:transcriptional regulator with XRE-family HTH domain
MIWTQIGQRMKGIRLGLRMTRTQFAKLVGLSSQQIGLVERGVSGLSVESVIRICNATGVSSDFLLQGSLYYYEISQELQPRLPRPDGDS